MDTGVEVLGSAVTLFGGGNWSHAQAEAPANNNVGPTAGVENKTITLRKKLDKSGLEVKIKVPVAEFVGVAVSTRITEEGELSSAIELVHPNHELNYQVYEETGNAEIVAEWQNWGQKLRLPLYIRAGDGTLVPYSQQVSGLMLGDNSTRRKTASEAGRRPRFLNRRQTGLAIVS